MAPIFPRRARPSDPPPHGLPDPLALPSGDELRQPDPWLPPLERAEAFLLRTNVMAAVRASGRTPTLVDGTRVVADDGLVLDLAELLRSVGGRLGPDGLARVEAQVAAHLGPARPKPSPLAGLDGRVIATVVPPSAVGDARPATALADDLPVYVAVVDGERAPVLTEPDRFGGWERLGPEATASLRALPVPETHVVGFVGGGEAVTFTADDSWGASRVLVIEDLMTHVARATLSPRGLFVQLRHVQTVGASVVGDPERALSSVRGLASLAARPPSGVPLLSPHVYHRALTGRLRRVTEWRDGGLAVDERLVRELAAG